MDKIHERLLNHLKITKHYRVVEGFDKFSINSMSIENFLHMHNNTPYYEEIEEFIMGKVNSLMWDLDDDYFYMIFYPVSFAHEKNKFKKMGWEE